jgi:hypothetical protein
MDFILTVKNNRKAIQFNNTLQKILLIKLDRLCILYLIVTSLLKFQHEVNIGQQVISSIHIPIIKPYNEL